MMGDVIEQIDAKISLIALKPGDALLLLLNQRMPQSWLERINDHIRQKLPEIRVLLCGPEVERVAVLRKQADDMLSFTMTRDEARSDQTQG